MFLRFGKAGWDYVTKGNIFICTHYFFLFLSISLSCREQLQRYVSQNLILGILYSLSIFETLHVFYQTLSVTNLVLGGVRLLLSRIPYLRL